MFFLRQFSLLRFALPEGWPGPGRNRKCGTPSADGDAKVGPGKRPAKLAKRRQSEPQPICNINVKQVSSKIQKAKSTPVAKETKSK